jgi:type I restriction enzyme M protein
MGTLINRRTRELTDEDIRKIADTYHNWKKDDGSYKDIPGFCKCATLDEVRELDYVLTPGRYVGLPEEEDDFDFEERVKKLTAELKEQMEESVKLDERIKENLKKVGIEL